MPMPVYLRLELTHKNATHSHASSGNDKLDEWKIPFLWHCKNAKVISSARVLPSPSLPKLSRKS
jgi:hypothetical protein